MAKKYKTIMEDYTLEMGIYDNCGWAIQSNGERFRIKYDLIVWEENSGAIRDRTVYLNKKDGRTVLKALRCARAQHTLGMCNGYTPYEVASQQLCSNWDNTPASVN